MFACSIEANIYSGKSLGRALEASASSPVYHLANSVNEICLPLTQTYCKKMIFSILGTCKLDYYSVHYSTNPGIYTYVLVN